MKNIENIRTNYNLSKLEESNLKYSPINQFKIWFSEIVDQVLEPNAMVLSTCSQHNIVSSRVVLLKEIQRDGFIFYTNYNSVKGKHIKSNSNVSLSFFWPSFQRQVRVNGIAVKTSHQKSVNYFKKRPRKSQIAAWASFQSEEVENRTLLESLFSDFEKKFNKKIIPKPPDWGGYKVIPQSVEFWQGRQNRMHDRFLYVKKNSKWLISRLAP
tara:strand:- start:213 stop:848 length:636 start_codon:yes stop_codon:yes gene_type:complete